MTKKGFTLMELLVSIFISGMVMLALVAMWKTSSNQTAEAQRQSIIKNDITIFLRKLYSDFLSAIEILCPQKISTDAYTCPANTYIAVKEVVISSDTSKLNRITAPVCGAGNNAWANNEEDLENMASRCIQPSYTVYNFESNNVYRCHFPITDTTQSIDIHTLLTDEIHNACRSANREIIMPYVNSFSLQTPSDFPGVLIDYTVKKEFTNDLPPVYFKFKRYLTKKGGA